MASLRPVPRYLFRVWSETFAGHNSETSFSSYDASQAGDIQSRIIALSNAMKKRAYQLILRNHFLWETEQTDYPSDLVSFSVSLLYCLLQGYRKVAENPGVSVYLTMVDTAKYVPVRFFSALDMIEWWQACNVPGKVLDPTNFDHEYVVWTRLDVTGDRSRTMILNEEVANCLAMIYPDFFVNPEQLRPMRRMRILREAWSRSESTLEVDQITAAQRIADRFDGQWAGAMLLYLLTFKRQVYLRSNSSCGSESPSSLVIAYIKSHPLLKIDKDMNSGDMNGQVRLPFPQNDVAAVIPAVKELSYLQQFVEGLMSVMNHASQAA